MVVSFWKARFEVERCARLMRSSTGVEPLAPKTSLSSLRWASMSIEAYQTSRLLCAAMSMRAWR